MADNALDRALWCLIEGETVPFNVKVPISETIDDLKVLIWEKRKNTLRDIDASRLIVLKASTC